MISYQKYILFKQFFAYLLSDFNTTVGNKSCLSNFDSWFAMNVICPLIPDVTSPEA